MDKTCQTCGNAFEITSTDLTFYEKVSPVFGGKKYPIPAPELCPDCRQQRRLAFRNERKFYYRKCNLTGKQIISIYSPEKPLIVYQADEWWSDTWDAISYGREFDFSRPFFEQFLELRNVVPRVALFGKNNENCDYTNHTENSKNCYLCVSSAAEDTYFSKWMIDCRDCCDSYQVEQAECCYEMQYGKNLFNIVYSFMCDESSNLTFCYDCIGCHDCLLSSHLRHKQFCIINEQFSEAEYRRRMTELDLGSHHVFQELLKRYKSMLQQTFHRANEILLSENCSGDFMYHNKNVRESFGIIESQDAAYCYDAGHLTDCMDVYESAFDCELQYECHACNRGKRLLGCSVCYDVDSCLYCDTCHNSSDLFGCVGLRRKKYCILNKQYTKEAYEELVPRIIEHMKQTPLNPPLSGGKFIAEWGSYFPPSLSPFAYNETVAQEYYPLEKTVAEQMGWIWKQENQEENYLGPETQIPDDIRDVSDDICEKILRCQVTQKPYRIISQELQFYRKMGIPVPRLCPDERHNERMAFTNPRRLYDRNCSNCGKAVRTTFAPDRSEKILCERCYEQAVN